MYLILLIVTIVLIVMNSEKNSSKIKILLNFQNKYSEVYVDKIMIKFLFYWSNYKEYAKFEIKSIQLFYNS